MDERTGVHPSSQPQDSEDPTCKLGTFVLWEFCKSVVHSVFEGHTKAGRCNALSYNDFWVKDDG